MQAGRAYHARKRVEPSRRTREQIVAAVRELLEEGVFHETTVEDVAGRAGVARATLYQHFGSRLGLVDAMCETFGANPALRALKEAAGLDELVLHLVDFWAGEEKVLTQLYGVAAVDPAARDLTERQRRDRYGVLRRLVARLRESGELRPGVTDGDAFARLAVLTSFETYLELRRHAGLSRRDVVRTL
jgi:AcrR family transcriptional regulator